MTRTYRSFLGVPMVTIASVSSVAVVACGLSLSVDANPDLAGLDASLADRGAPDPPDGGPPNPPDAEVEGSDAGEDASVPDANCTTVLKEDFSGDGGALVHVVPAGGLAAGGALTLVSRGVRSSAGAAYANLAPITGFEATFTFTTEALGNTGDTADGFAVSWLELELPDNATFRDGPNFGMTNDPQNQHGYGFFADLYANPRKFVETEVESNDPTNDRGTLATITTQGPVKLVGKIVRRNGNYVYELTTPGENILVSGGAPRSTVVRSTTDRDPSMPYRAFVFSAGSGGRDSPGFHLDELEIKSCDP